MFKYMKKFLFVLAFIFPMLAFAETATNTQSNFKKFIACKDETRSLSGSLSSATENSKSFEKTIDNVIEKFESCRKLAEEVKQEASSVDKGSEVVDAANISQERMKLEEKILVQIRDNSRLNQFAKENATQSDKDFQALQIANSYVRQAEDLAWTKISIRHNDSKIDSISFYNFFSIIFLIYFVIFIFNRNIKKKKV